LCIVSESLQSNFQQTNVCTNTSFNQHQTRKFLHNKITAWEEFHVIVVQSLQFYTMQQYLQSQLILHQINIVIEKFWQFIHSGSGWNQSVHEPEKSKTADSSNQNKTGAKSDNFDTGSQCYHTPYQYSLLYIPIMTICNIQATDMHNQPDNRWF